MDNFLTKLTELLRTEIGTNDIAFWLYALFAMYGGMQYIRKFEGPLDMVKSWRDGLFELTIFLPSLFARRWKINTEISEYDWKEQWEPVQCNHCGHIASNCKVYYAIGEKVRKPIEKTNLAETL